MLGAHDAPGQVFAGELAALEVERVAAAVIRRIAKGCIVLNMACSDAPRFLWYHHKTS
jgi:hypothetical protein